MRISAIRITVLQRANKDAQADADFEAPSSRVEPFIVKRKEVAEIAEHIEKLKMQNCSENIVLVKNMPLVREVNTALNGIELVASVPKSNVEFYERWKAYAEKRTMYCTCAEVDEYVVLRSAEDTTREQMETDAENSALRMHSLV